MAKKRNNVSINTLEKYCDGLGQDVIEMTFPEGDESSITFEVKKILSLEETMRYIEDVVSASIMEDDLMIVPVAREYINRKNVLTYYANFTMPSNSSKAYELVMGASELIDEIIKSIDEPQYKMIQRCIDERIEFEKHKMLSTQVQQIQKLAGEIEHMTDNFSALFNGVNGEQMSDFIKNMSELSKNANVTGQDIARAMVENKS